MNSFGEKLKHLRKQKKLTQAQLAERLNLDQSSISYYEQNKKIPDINTLEQIAQFFDVTLDQIWAMGTSFSTTRFQQAVGRATRAVNSPYITPDDLKEKFKLVVDGREATDEEIEEAIRYILIQRMMKESKD